MSGAKLLKTAAAIATALALSACGSKAPAKPENIAMDRAVASSQRGAAAFARNDLGAAQGEYLAALRLYESIADTQGRAATLLSLARIESQAGRPKEALAAVQQVLAEGPSIAAGTRIMAHGRAAGLQLELADFAAATMQLDAAGALCGGACAERAALEVLRARIALAQKQPETSLRLASGALALLAVPSAERASALRVQAQSHAALGQHEAAIAASQQALEIDRSLGLGERVVLDLQLLAQSHKAMGSQAQAQRYEELAARARAAGRALRGEQP
jgi:tetratricopeptide (TPR) repeat protein